MNVLYRKTDILNRLYILFHSSHHLLEAPYIFNISDIEITAPITNIQITEQLMLFSLPAKKIHSVFQELLIYLLSQNSLITFDGKVLVNLKRQMLPKLFETILKPKPQYKTLIHTKSNELKNIILNYLFDDIVIHLSYVYFYPISDMFTCNIFDRIINKLPDMQLIDEIKNIKFTALVTSFIKITLPNSFQIMQSLINDRTEEAVTAS